MESKERLKILAIAIVFVGFSFYWYELRLGGIRKQCNESADRESDGWEKDYDYIYKKCLRSKGL